ncbi:hypothetical protein Daus18300_012950 [Diaporthe australafricana]|uniref:Uncharacterized protein n=1 Tax=Diaporthe australafricana TaxID=127596 RepID=A0ABR3W0X9_9PEZI
MFVKSKNKKRLFVAVYPSGQGTGTYHWALLVGPKVEGDAAAGQRYHVKNQPVGPRWKYDPGDLQDVRVTAQLLARVTVAKIVNEKRLIKTLAKVPVDPPDWKGKADGSEPRWTCRVWVIAALEAIRDDGKIVGTNCLDDIDGPNGIIERVKAFVASQIAGKRFSPPHDAMAPKPLLNMLTGEELYL